MTTKIIPNGTHVIHLDIYMRHLWGVGTIVSGVAGKQRGKAIVLYRVQFEPDEGDTEMSAEDLTITVRGDELEEVL